MTLRTPFSSLLLALPLLGATGGALADDAAMLHCRTLTAGAARLACYDAIPVASPAAARSVEPGAAAAVAAPAAQAAGATSVAAASVAAAPAASAEQSFGLEQPKRAEPLRSIESTLTGTIDGWNPSSVFNLANGQAWKVADGSSADFTPKTNPKVRITRSLVGTMFLEIEGTNNSPKVRRVR